MAIKNIVIFNKEFDVSYEIVNFDGKKDIVFLHGWGSNKDIMKNAFKNTLKDFRHIYIDMPGFGKSTNDYILHTNDYALIVDKLLKILNSKIAAIVGHSYGGKVATLLNPQNLVLLSSSGILQKKSLRVKLKITLSKLFNKLSLNNVSKIFRSEDVKLMNENMYETFKNIVDEDFTKYFLKFHNKAFIFWGENDNTTPLCSGEKIAQLIKNSTFKLYKGDHYFFCKHAKEIAKTIENAIL